jgi:hypothetical protein
VLRLSQRRACGLELCRGVALLRQQQVKVGLALRQLGGQRGVLRSQALERAARVLQVAVEAVGARARLGQRALGVSERRGLVSGLGAGGGRM